MNKPTPFAYCLLLSAGLLLHSLAAQAQAPGSGGPTPQAAPTAVPLDGGASLLLASGVAYGLRRLRRRRTIWYTKKLLAS